jgi:hypothetical protein
MPRQPPAPWSVQRRHEQRDAEQDNAAEYDGGPDPVHAQLLAGSIARL